MTKYPSRAWIRRRRLPSSDESACSREEWDLMLRKLGLKLGFLVIVVGSVIPVSAASKPGAISGYVRNSAVAPQMGVVEEVLGSAFHSFKVFTDENGFYSASDVIPGV